MLKEGSHRLKKQDSTFDILDDVIATLRFRGSIFFHSDLAAPWGISLPPLPTPRFHIALHGDFVIGTSEAQLPIMQMDIVMLPKGDMHWIADETSSELVPCQLAGDACELGNPLFQEGEITNRIMCGMVEYDEAISHPILDALPSIFHFTHIEVDNPIWTTVRQIDSEIQRTNSQRSVIIDRLTEVLFFQLLHRYIAENEHLHGFLAALRNPRLAKVLQLLHDNPEKPWTLATICNEAGMSRASLQRKFKAELDLSPMAYLGSWRLAKAYQLVKNSSLTLDNIADRIGYADARTLRAAFKRHYGFSPSALRKGDNEV
ncbi:AraC family transcriptional regulator [Shewanella woodyi]|uniref:AraC family transcriptional regulator n=1 Tax=Shewanella woodyi TaxID=60961 RepID=UPI0009EE8F8F|nr:AraC family transcriptional regulator [Shewanella woodyi]